MPHHHLTLISPALQFDFNPDAGRFALGVPDTPASVQGATAHATFDGHTQTTDALRVDTATQRRIDGAHGPGTQLTIDFAPQAGLSLALIATTFDRHPFLTLRLTLANHSAATVRVNRLVPLHVSPAIGGAIRLGPESGSLAFFKNGYQSWSYTGIRRERQRDIVTRLGNYIRPMLFSPTTPIARTPGIFGSDMFGALIDDRAQRAIVAGQIRTADQFAHVAADTRQGRAALTLACETDDVPLPPGGSIASEEMLIQSIDLPVDQPFADYYHAVARQMRPRLPSASPVGWCSWYYYFPRVREEDILANLRAADAVAGTIPIDLIQIDDGYQTKVGDWLSINGKFPRGMQWLADQIRQAGHTPGLWLAPFSAVRSSQVAQQHPDWLIRDEHGRPVIAGKGWNEDNYGLDMTHPGAQDYVRRVIDTAAHEWGYRYLKLDFLYAAALRGRRHDPTLTRAQALRRGLELIRETAGDDVFLLGCGCPLGPAIGIVDGMRIGPDVAPDPEPTWIPRYKGITLLFKHEAGFPSGRNAARNVLNRSGLHRLWWLNDPDCLIVRQARHMNEVEVRSWASLVGLSGGMVILSDDLPTLSPARQRYINAVLPVLDDAAQPLDLFEREMPELFVLRQERNWGSGVVAGVFNWDDRSTRKRIDLARIGLDPTTPHHAYEFWSGAYRRVEDGQIDLGTLPAHGCAIVAIRPVLDRPHLVATTFHITMGGEVERMEIGDSKLAIGIRLKRRASGEIWIAGMQEAGGQKAGTQVAGTQVAPGVFALQIEVDGSAQIDVTR